MEYVQMTIDDWVQMKQKLKQELLGVKQSFVRIGYALRKIEDQRLYEQDGYKSIAEFAKAEYGLEPSTTSRFISINREFSVDGYSEILRPEFADLGRSQLEEMLKLPASDRQMIQPETSREDIRDMKRFNKAEPETGVADDLRQLIEKFWREHLEILDSVTSRTFTEENIQQFAELVNPSGSRSYKKGLYFLMMYENRVAVKKFGQDPQNMTWWEFYQITEELIRDLQEERAKAPVDEEESEEKTADRQQETEEGKEIKDEEQRNEASGKSDSGSRGKTGRSGEGGRGEQNDRERNTEQTITESEEEESQGKEIAPAQKSAEILEREASDEVKNRENHGAAEKGASEPQTEEAEREETKETESSFEAMNQPEVIEKPYGSRKDYMDTLTAYGMAMYMAEEYERHNLKASALAFPSELEKWLLQEVDESGREIEEVEE